MADNSGHRSEKTIDSPREHEEYPGQTLVTKNHDVITKWARDRDGQPATVEGSDYGGRPGRLLLDFPGGSGDELVHIQWDKWFETFDERGLEFRFQEHTKDGTDSNFFHLVNPSND